jgi:uridine kinase
LGSVTRVEERFRNRYLPSQEYYFETVVPGDLAEVIVENENPEWPSWLIRSN